MCAVTKLTGFALLLPLAFAHFEILYPGSRGFNEDSHSEWPCGGFDTVSPNRSEFPLSGGPIQIDSTHTESYLQVLLAVGNEPEESFNVILVPTLHEQGPQEFCFGSVNITPGINLTVGSNATIQVISSGHSGGLYACVDITFTDAALSQDEYSANCRNSTGVTVVSTEIQGNANETGQHHESESSSPSNVASATSSSAAATTSATASGTSDADILKSQFVGVVLVTGAVALMIWMTFL